MTLWEDIVLWAGVQAPEGPLAITLALEAQQVIFAFQILSLQSHSPEEHSPFLTGRPPPNMKEGLGKGRRSITIIRGNFFGICVSILPHHLKNRLPLPH